MQRDHLQRRFHLSYCSIRFHGRYVVRLPSLSNGNSLVHLVLKILFRRKIFIYSLSITSTSSCIVFVAVALLHELLSSVDERAGGFRSPTLVLLERRWRFFRSLRYKYAPLRRDFRLDRFELYVHL